MSNPGVSGVPKCQKMQTSSQWRHMHNKRKPLKTCFSYIVQNVNNIYIIGYYFFFFLGGGARGLGCIQLWSDWAYLALQLSAHPYQCDLNLKITFKVHIQNMNQIKLLSFFFIFGGPGALTSNPGLTNLQGSKTSSQNKKCITRKQN